MYLLKLKYFFWCSQANDRADENWLSRTAIDNIHFKIEFEKKNKVQAQRHTFRIYAEKSKQFVI